MVLAVNEAVSNVIDHAYSPVTADDTFDITLRTEAGVLREAEDGETRGHTNYRTRTVNVNPRCELGARPRQRAGPHPL